MKVICCIFFTALSSTCFAQKYCRYNKPLKPQEYSIYTVNSELGGLLMNARPVARNYIQAEADISAGSFNNSYNSDVYAGLLQVRYGITNSTELQTGGSYIVPYEINPDTFYNTLYHVGLKQRFLCIGKKKIEWTIACAVKYNLQISGKPGIRNRHGILIALNNSWRFYKLLEFDLSFGSYYFISENSYSPLLSCNLLIKDEHSKIGIFMGIAGDYYIESLAILGLILTDNYNYALNISMGFADKAILPNLAYTHALRCKKL